MLTLRESVELSSTIEEPSFSLKNQKAHRRNIFLSWLQIAQENSYELESNITGKQTLDIGCGQGDMIEAFATVLKVQGNKESSIIGVDPASLDYGSPQTLGEVQSSLAAGHLKDYLSFHQSTAPELVESQPIGTYTTAYFAHSMYYFPSSATLVQSFKSLLDAGVKTLLLAEWSLAISQPEALSHLLAVLLQSTDPLPEGNVRTVLSPKAYIDAAGQAGWELVGSRTFTPVESQQDGQWEVGYARSVAAKREATYKTMKDSSERNAQTIFLESVRAHADALECSMASGEVAKVRCMDTWTAVFQPAQAGSGTRNA